MLSDILLSSLNSQTCQYELILIDNTEGIFKSAAQALNYGGKKARGDFILFVHQDISIDEDDWLERTECILKSLKNLGIAGIVGMSSNGKNFKDRWRGYVWSGDEIWPWCKPIESPVEVQTLDECLLIIPRNVFIRLQFDEKTFDGWHCYGIDYCLNVTRLGLKAYTLPGTHHHYSLSTNVKNLSQYQKRLLSKHKSNYKVIFTTCGEISALYLPILFLKNKFIEKKWFMPFYKFGMRRKII